MDSIFLGGGSVLLGGVSGFLDFAPALLMMPRGGVSLETLVIAFNRTVLNCFG